MIVCVVVDDNYGVMFNGRRQSRDRVLINELLNISKDSKLWINSFSSKLIPLYYNHICISEDFLSQAGSGEYCFVEGLSIEEYIDKVEKLVVFKWNRVYPADTFFKMPEVDKRLVCVKELEGYSHEKISMEVWEIA